MDAGLVFMVFNAMDIALLNTWVLAQTPDTMGRFLSWNTIVILVTAMILPTTAPWKMLTASMAAATMDPIGVWIAHLRGFPVPSVLATFVFFVRTTCRGGDAAVSCWSASRLRLRAAREMGSYQLVELLGRGRDGRGGGRAPAPGA